VGGGGVGGFGSETTASRIYDKKNYRYYYTYLGAVVRVHVFGLEKNKRLRIRKTLVGSSE